MTSSGRGVLALLTVVTVTALLLGCGTRPQLSAEERVTVQEAQLKEFVERADAWGAEVLAQIPSSEIELVSDNAGGARKASDYYEEWPKYYYWDQIVVLHADNVRSPSEVADDLEPWLER